MTEIKRTIKFNCQTCGACCCSEVRCNAGDVVEQKYLAPGGKMRMVRASDGLRCAALSGAVGKSVTCLTYRHRPTVCREVKPGDRFCLHMRAVFELEGGKLDKEIFSDSVKRMLGIRED